MTVANCERVGLEHFVAQIAEILGKDGSSWVGDSRLVDDCGFDSLDYYETLCTLEHWTGTEFDDELVVTWETIDDLHRCYTNN